MLGITFEGGASRTVYSCGIMDALLEEGIYADYAIGVSAGAAFGVSYASKQIGRNYTLATEIMNRKEYMGPHNLLDPKNKCYYGLKYAFDTVPNEILPFDYDAFEKSNGFTAVVTNIETGEAEYLEVPMLYCLTPLKYFDVYTVAMSGIQFSFLLLAMIIAIGSVITAQRVWMLREI